MRDTKIKIIITTISHSNYFYINHFESTVDNSCTLAQRNAKKPPSPITPPPDRNRSLKIILLLSSHIGHNMAKNKSPTSF